MFGAGIGSGKIKLKRPDWLKMPEMKSPFKSGSVSNLFSDLQIKNSKRISDFVKRFKFNSSKFSSQLKRECPEIYEKLNGITKNISNNKYVTLSMNGTGQLRNISLEKVNKFVKDILELVTVIKNCTDEDQLKKIVKMCDDGDIDGLRQVIELTCKPTSKLVGYGLDLSWLSNKYRAVDVYGTVKVNGEVIDVSRRLYQLIEIDWDYVSSHPDALGRSNRELKKKVILLFI